MRASFITITAVVVAGVIAAHTPAHAQGYGPGYYAGPPPPPAGLVRSGFIAGVGIGGGGFGLSDCEDCDALGVGAFHFHLGGMIAPTVAILFDAEGVAGKYNEDITISQGVALAAIRFWPARILWLQGGLGFARLGITSDALNTTFESDTGGALMLGLGVELLQTRSFALDVQLRLTASRYGDNERSDDFGIAGATLSAGFNWY